VNESGVCPVDVTPPWISMLMYCLGDEKWARWWPQFRDVVLPVSPHQRDRHIGRLSLKPVIKFNVGSVLFLSRCRPVYLLYI
jgi:hypothetical protein